MAKYVDPMATAERIENTVPTAENEVAPKAEPTIPSASGASPDTAPTDAPGGDAPTAPVESAPEPSRRDKFREGIKGRNADLDMEDDNAYYDYLDSQLGERDGYESALNNLRDSIDKSPEFAEMLTEAANQENYSPIHYLLRKVAEGDIDLDELANDPEYVDKFTAAQAEALKKKETQQKIDEEGQKNFEESIACMRKIQEERGLTDDEVNQAMEKVYKIFDDLCVNKISPETFNAILDSMNYEKDVQDAREAGQAEGLNTKVKDTLAKTPRTNNRVGGSQSSMPEAKAEPRQNSMFGL